MKTTEVKQLNKYKLLLWGTITLWIIIVSSSLTWNYYNVKSSVFELARIQAQSNFDKDILYRRWNAGNGGVYVSPSENTPPNPYLKDHDKRDVITTSGEMLTLINPAYMTRQVHELGAKQGGIKGHITSLKPIRPENAPDSWERMALLSFEQGLDERVELVEKDNDAYLRFMRPLITEQACLKCHNAQGYQVGDVRGGISVSVPYGPFISIMRQQQERLLLGHAVIGILGLLGLWLGGKRLGQSRKYLTDSLQETRQLAAQNHLLLAGLGEGVYGADREGRCIFINPAALKMLGYKQDEVIGRYPHDLFHVHSFNDETHVSQRCPVLQTLKDGQLRETEGVFLCKDGQELQVSLIITAMKETNDIETLDGVIVSFRDITEQRSVTNRLKTLLDNASDGIHILDEKGNVVEFSKSFANMLGYTAEEMGRLNVADWEVSIPKGEQETLIKQLMNNQITFETRHRRKDGSLYDAEINATGVVLDGQTHLYASSRDITKRKEIENALQETKNHLATVVDTIPDLIWLKNLDGVYLACNQEFQLFFGAVEQEILGKTDYDFVPRDLADFFRQKDQEAIAANKVNINEEEVTYASNGRRATLETRKVPILDINGNIRGILGIGRDITERKKAELALKNANEKLKDMAMQDGLTQVANRRYFDIKLENEWDRMLREKQPLSLIIFDVDFFKRYNDTYGHLAGDVCLQAISSKARKCFKRPGDLLARYGGEEFAVILPNTSNEGASALTEELRRQIYDIEMSHEASSVCKFVTVSCGVSTIIPSKLTNFQILIEAADKALYQAKERGRNRVVSRNIH